MENHPWLSIPLADYEGHMNSQEVQQLGVLSELFEEALAYCRPASIAVLGVAGGNGLDRVDRSITKRIAGVDINPLYLEDVAKRYGDLPGLELHCTDLAAQTIDVAPVQLVHAALVFEHAGVDLCLKNALTLVAPGGFLSAVLQLPSEVSQGVGASPFPSLQTLASHFSFIDPKWFREALAAQGLKLAHETQRSLPAGKSLWMGIFRRP